MSFYQMFDLYNKCLNLKTTRFPWKTFLIKDKHISAHYVTAYVSPQVKYEVMLP